MSASEVNWEKPLAIVALGNPLLDIIVLANGDDLIEKYKLPVNGNLEVNREQEELFTEVMEKFEIETSPGGGAQNTLRIFQQLVGNGWTSFILGQIGHDKAGSILRHRLGRDGVHVKYAYKENLPTGCCVGIVRGENRCLAANIGAARGYSPEHLHRGNCFSLLQQTRVLYIEGYFLTHSFQAAFQTLTYVHSLGRKIRLLSLSADYVCHHYYQQISQLLPYVNLLFGNDGEYRILATKLGILTDDIVCIAKSIAGYHYLAAIHQDRQLLQPGNLDFNGQSEIDWLDLSERLVVITRGSHSVICATRTYCWQFPVGKLSTQEIVDTTGAGDAFLAGFLTRLINGQSLENSVHYGDHIAKLVIGQRGCQLPRNCTSV